MDRLPFIILDVFAEKKYAGNQLAVFRNSSRLQDSEMQQIARETNFSETTFILSDQPRDSGYDVRIFTPAAEVPFAGHPTLGTAFAIQQEIIRARVDSITLNLKVGPIPVRFSYIGDQPDILRMRQNRPTFGPSLDRDSLARVLRVAREDIDDRFPVQEVSTGLPFIIVPLKTLAAVRQARLDRDRYFALIEKTESKAILLFAPEAYSPENGINARMFGDYYGVSEDPATGSANGCLAGWLVKHRYFGTDHIDVRVEQGYEISRPSLLMLTAAETQQGIDVSVGGRVKMVARGEFV